MSTRNWLNLALAGVALALVLVAVFKPGVEEAPPVTHLTALRPADVTRIRIERPGSEAVALLRDGEHWRMEAPRAVPANDFRVQQLLDLLQAESGTRYAVNQLDLGKLQLDPPRASIRFNDLLITFGDINPLDYRRYVRVGDAVHLVHDTVFDEISGPYTDLVSTALLPENSQIAEIRLPGGARLAQQDGKWTLDPPQPHISADTLQALVDEWRHTRALQVTDYGTGEGKEGDILVHLKDAPEPLRFDIISSEPEFVLGRRDWNLKYVLPDASFGRLTTLHATADKPAGDKP